MPSRLNDAGPRIKHISLLAQKHRARLNELHSDYARGDRVSLDEVRAAIREVQALFAELQPVAGVAAEFKQKWELQRRQLISRRETEIETALRTESQAETRAAEQVATEELAAQQLSFDAESKRSTSELCKEEHTQQIQAAVEVWRSCTHGAKFVRKGTIAIAVNKAVERLSTWVFEGENELMKKWQDEVNGIVAKAHAMDHELLTSLCKEREVKRQALRGHLQNTQKNLQIDCIDLQDQLSHLGGEIERSLSQRNAPMTATSPRQNPRRIPFQPRVPVKMLSADCVGSTLEHAEQEALAAAEAYRRSAIEESWAKLSYH